MTTATLSAKVTADIAEFSKKFGEVSDTINKVSKAPASVAASMSSSTSTIEESSGKWKMAMLGIGAAVTAGLYESSKVLTQWASEISAATEKIAQISQQTGIAEATLEGWQVALARTGGDTQQFATAFKELSKEIVAAREETDFASTKFAAMGLSLKDLGSTETVILAVADKIQNTSDAADRAKLATDLLGKAGLALLPALMQGSQGLTSATEAAKKFGLVLDESTRNSLLQYDDSLDDLGKAWEGLKTRVVVAAVPILQKGIELAQSSISMSLKIVDAITRMVEGISGAFKRLTAIFDNVRAKTEEVTGFFRKMYDAVVGHSYVPDMVDEIGQHMRKLDANMAAPARAAAVSVEDTFRGMQLTIDGMMEDLRNRASYTVGSMIGTLSSAFSGAIQGMSSWAQMGQQILNMLLTNSINMALTWATQWAAQEAMRLVATETTNTAIAASTTATGGIMAATFTTVMTGIKATIFAVARTAISVISTMIAALTPVMMGVATVIGTVLETVGMTIMEIGMAMESIPIIGTVLGTILMGLGAITMAAGVALPGIVGGVMGGLAAGVGALGSMIPAMAAGGIVTGPTLALIGEAGPEAVVPLSRGGIGQPTKQTIVIQLDGRTLTRYVSDALIPNLRLRGVPI